VAVKIQLLSDLHLESHPDFHPRPAPGAQLLVLAGDIGSYQRGSRLPGADFGLERFAPRLGWPVPVLYVPGNHEYDNLDFDATHARLRETCCRLGITWLDREVLVLDGVRFIGTTLWSDFDALVAPTGQPQPDLARALKLREKAFRAANFYLEKAACSRHGQPFMAQEVRQEGLACQAWLQAALAQPFQGPTVVVTHFAPSLRSADPRYGLVPGTAGFCNALDHLLPLADLWIHGHLHCRNDYEVPAPNRPGGVCRVVANALGYFSKGEQEHFDPGFTIEVPVSAYGNVHAW
jgi:hypothetical protein